MAVILLVDDDPIFRDMYTMRLVKEGHIVHQANDGMGAVNRIGEISPDLVLLDVMMPKMNGLDVIKILRDDEKNRNLPVIILTALNADLSSGYPIVEQANRYLLKSEVNPDHLAKIISEMLESRQI